MSPIVYGRCATVSFKRQGYKRHRCFHLRGSLVLSLSFIILTGVSKPATISRTLERGLFNKESRPSKNQVRELEPELTALVKPYETEA